MLECVWVLDYEDDIDADFLRFYGIDLTKVDAVDSARYMKLAIRLPAYGGVMAVRVEQAQEEAKKHNPSKGLRDGTAKEVPLSEIMSMDFSEPT